VDTDLVLDEEIRRAVRFEERNLADEDRELWQAGAYDVIFCRNVLMYFTPQIAQALVGRLTYALAPDGYLFLGHAETLRGLSHDYHLRHTHGTFYYQRKQDHEIQDSSLAPRPASVQPPSAFPLAALVHDSSWVDAICQAADRIQALTHGSETSRPSSGGTARLATPAPCDLGHALDLLRKEQFSDALAVVHSLPVQSARDPDVLLLRAVLLTHSGRLAEADDACRRLLEVDELNAGAHYLLALCSESRGDRQGANEHDQIAAYLDPGFAMARLHQGLLARRAGQADIARRELGQALILLEREDSSRLLLFGGGFAREALIGLCRSELVACEKAYEAR
jgi:chemotaxis protein methyltransferase CheR